MAWRDWAVPLAAGVVGGLLLWSLGPREVDEEAPAPEPADWNGTGWVFLEGPRVAATPSNVSLLFVPPTGDLEVETLCPASGCLGEAPVLMRLGDGLLSAPAQDYRIVCIRAPCDQPPAPYITRDAAPGEIRFGVDGFNATKLSFYAFNLDGEVLASSAPDADLARFRLSGAFIRLPDSVWYLGENATTPPGTARLPATLAPFLSQARPLLEGLPVGGVATVSTTHWALGELWLTARIDGLLQTP